MSGPEVGDRVRVHGEPFRGQYGHVADPTLVASAYLWDLWVTLDGDTGPHGFDLNEVEKVPTTPDCEVIARRLSQGVLDFGEGRL